MTEKVGLMDLKPATVDVPFTLADGTEKTIAMRALSVLAVARLIEGFPVVRKLFSGGLKSGDFNLESMVTGAPEFVAEVIAAGSGQPGDKEVIAHVRDNLSVGLQLSLLEGTINATLEGGMAPFVARLGRLLNAFGADMPEVITTPIEEPATT